MLFNHGNFCKRNILGTISTATKESMADPESKTILAQISHVFSSFKESFSGRVEMKDRRKESLELVLSFVALARTADFTSRLPETLDRLDECERTADYLGEKQLSAMAKSKISQMHQSGEIRNLGPNFLGCRHLAIFANNQHEKKKRKTTDLKNYAKVNASKEE